MEQYFVINDTDGQISTVVDWDGESDISEFVNQTLLPAVDGVPVGWFRQTNGTYAPTDLGRAKSKMRELVNVKLQEKFEEGYTPSSGPLLGHTLQCRNVEDRTNWLTSQTSYMAAIQMGYGAVPGAVFRTTANETVTVTFSQGLDVLTSGMAVWGKDMMAHSWTLKDEIAAAKSQAELDDIDMESGWPIG